MFHLFLAFAAGYILAVLFPNYRLNAYIADMWKWIGDYLAAHKATSTPAATPTPTPVSAAPNIAAPRPTTQRVNPPTK